MGRKKDLRLKTVHVDPYVYVRKNGKVVQVPDHWRRKPKK